MITLITGIPGMGKTSLLITMLLKHEKAAERPLFVMGIPDLKLEHIPAPPVAEWTEYRQSPEDKNLQLAYFTFPPNSILIIDEAQRVYRPRSSGSKVPPEVAALETHRHTGLDIILITQKPKLLEVNVRELIGKHIHIRAGLVGRWLYEWPHIADGESRLDRGDATKRKFKPPKQSFQHYKSAEVHTKHKFRIHQGYYFLMIALAFLGYQLSSVFDIFNKHTQPKSAHAQTLQAGDTTTRSSASRVGVASNVYPTNATAFPVTLTESMTPVDAEDPLSAPIYSETKPKPTPPMITGCIASKKNCICYTHQNTSIWIPQAQCRTRAAGNFYDPYKPPESESRQGVIPQTTAKQQTRPPPEGGPEQI